MKDENGKPMGVLSHLVKTHVSESSDTDMISALNKDLDDIKIDDQFSNEDILSYTNPHPVTNKQNLLLDAVDVSSDKEKFKASITPENPKGQINLSSRTNTSNTGLED